MLDDDHRFFCKFMEKKPSVFKGTYSEDTFEFLIDCHKHLHKICCWKLFYGFCFLLATKKSQEMVEVIRRVYDCLTFTHLDSISK